MTYNSQREKSDRRIQSVGMITNAIFGILIIGMGIIFLKKDHFQIQSINSFLRDYDPFLIQMFGAICLLYGFWRLYRSYLKFKEN